MTKVSGLLVSAALGFEIANASIARGEDLFNGAEPNLSLFGSWVDKRDSDFAPGLGFGYFFTQRLGVGMTTFWENYEGTLFDNVSAEGYFRWPLGEMNLAPYGMAALGYSFETSEGFEMLGGGVEWRLHPKWGLFGEVRWQFNNQTDDGAGIRVGARLVF